MIPNRYCRFRKICEYESLDFFLDMIVTYNIGSILNDYLCNISSINLFWNIVTTARFSNYVCYVFVIYNYNCFMSNVNK